MLAKNTRVVMQVRFTTLLTSAVLGVYLLVVAGATASLAEAAVVCPTWPGCALRTDPAAAVALGHRLAAALVGVLVFASAIVGWRRGASRRVCAALGVALTWQLEAETVTDDAERAPGSTTTPKPLDSTDQVADVPGRETATSPPGSAPHTFLTRAKVTVLAYVRLTKPRLMWLLCLVASAGMALAAGADLRVGTIVATLGGGVLAIGASGTFNHVLERDVDRRMQRTVNRPVATRQVPARNAIVFGVMLTVLSLATFLQVNLLAAVLGLVAILSYRVIYTLLLKPNTVQNTVLGGTAGAIPALIG